MQAHVGDQLRIRGRAIGVPDRVGEVIEVRGSGGTPPFLVRWDDSGHDGLFFPGNDAVVEPLGEHHDEIANYMKQSAHHGDS